MSLGLLFYLTFISLFNKYHLINMQTKKGLLVIETSKASNLLQSR